jgi:hypothetical protein
MEKAQDHSGIQSGGIQKDSRNNADGDTKVTVAAQRLAIRFTEDADLPVRYRKGPSSASSSKVKKDSEVELRFKADVKKWAQLIETMLAKIDYQQAWRFVNLRPRIDSTVRRLTECKDFCDFTDYLILRRDNEKCGADELGGLAMLSGAFQREIEKSITARGNDNWLPLAKEQS